jgi:hypothetical protein
MSESITTIEKLFNINFNNFIIADFMIDADDVNKYVKDDTNLKFSFSNPTLKINVIKFNEEKNSRVSSFVLYDKEFIIYDKEFVETIEWELLQKIEVDYCMILILNEDNLKNNELDDWLEKCISLKELYKVEDDGRMCLYSGFGPGIYKLLCKKIDGKICALKIEFIKETV